MEKTSPTITLPITVGIKYIVRKKLLPRIRLFERISAISSVKTVSNGILSRANSMVFPHILQYVKSSVNILIKFVRPINLVVDGVISYRYSDHFMLQSIGYMLSTKKPIIGSIRYI